MRNKMRALLVIALGLSGFVRDVWADEFEQVLQPLFAQSCVKCHGDNKANAEINFQQVTSRAQLQQQLDLLQKAIEAIDTGAMPPDSEPPLNDTARSQAVAILKSLLREASKDLPRTPQPLQRLNRFQYNNTVRDLFQLNRDVFALPEKLMTRYDQYLQWLPDKTPQFRVPDTVHVASHSLDPQPGLEGVKSFPKDLRAAHGFDNQANQLTLSPLLLDTFLRLGVSVMESPDFNAQTVGIWNSFFAEPASDVDRRAEVRQRLTGFLRIAFRGAVDDETLDRYTSYAAGKMDRGLSFTEGMKTVAAAVLSSPLFLYRTAMAEPGMSQFELASRLSYFLWGSCPDEELLKSAEQGELSRPDVLDRTITRMLANPKVERFLDAFPGQWMQLENALAATPDPQLSEYFHLVPEAPASLQFVLEPLLLFDAVYLEDRPLAELISPTFLYHSDFLQTWYNTDLRPPEVDVAKLVADNQKNESQRLEYQTKLRDLRRTLLELTEPVRARLLTARRESQAIATAVDLRPFAAWEFDGNLEETQRDLDLIAHGDVEFRDGLVILNKAYLISNPLPVDFRAKSLEVWCLLEDPDQPGGGLMGIQGPGDFFDTIVMGERKNGHWISGSNGFSRTKDFPESTEETQTSGLLHLVMVYAEDGTTTLYRNGELYGQPYNAESAVFPRETSTVLFGLRHLPADVSRFLTVSIDRARLYDRALTAEEVAMSASGHGSFVTDQELMAALTEAQATAWKELFALIAEADLKLQQVPADSLPEQAIQAVKQGYRDNLSAQLRSREFRRIPSHNARFGGIITNAAMLSMTSGAKRTHPVARGVWIIEVLFNDPPPPPPNDVPPFNEETAAKDLTIREQFAAHRANPSCAGCHSKLDPLGFALENYDITGRWRDRYDNGRDVDASGTLFRKHDFHDIVRFKESLVEEHTRFARAFTEHLLRFALARQLVPADTIAIDEVLLRTAEHGFTIRSLIREVIASESFCQ